MLVAGNGEWGMAIVADDKELQSNCRAGMTLRTRDRREAIVESVSSEEGLIFGRVQMHGPCVWRGNGRYRDAPFGAAGPLDLMPPATEAASPAGPEQASVKEALAENNRLYCCD